MNTALVEKDGFTVVERGGGAPPAGAEPMVLPESKSVLASRSNAPQEDLQNQSADLKAVPFGPASVGGNSTRAKESKKAPMLP